MLIAAKYLNEVNQLKELLHKQFDIKDFGATKKILAIEICRDRTARKLWLSQGGYVHKVLERISMTDTKSVCTPLASHFKLSTADYPSLDEKIRHMSKVPYASVVGSLIYAMTRSRPDLAHAVSVASRVDYFMGELILEKIHTSKNAADMLMKSVTYEKFKHYLELLHVSKDHLVEKCGSAAAATEMMKWENISHLSYEFWRKKNNKLLWAREVWYCGSPPKHAFCLWLGVKGKLLTCDRMMGEDIDQVCVFYKAKNETLDHLFFRCKVTAEVWNAIRRWLGIKRQMPTIKVAVKWLHKEAKGKGMVAASKKNGLAATVYFIWHFRNRCKFENHGFSSSELISVIQRHTYRGIYDKFEMYALE
ncbi:uncharacterized protein LOC131148498 [Malania oleifera]|uniref:uncharacterized protein LOC131148498 n=1 Tax=Malania oleifera TaxID=397392 RepID=UPI0025AE06EA|nr:uncharacterized protein LOC131148498 [Malania oleifera]